MRFLLATFSFLLIGLCAQAQTSKPIRWSISLSKSEVKQGETIEIIMTAEINADWYLYSSDFNPDLGPTVSSVQFENNDSFKSLGNLKPIGAKEKYDSLWGGKIHYFTKHAEFRQKIKILKTNPKIKGVLSYQVCSDKEGKCIPFDEKILFDKLKVVAAQLTPEKNPTTDNTEATPENSSSSKNTNISKDNLSALEAEKEKLIQKDNNGNDVVVNQLKAFTQKYGGDK